MQTLQVDRVKAYNDPIYFHKTFLPKLVFSTKQKEMMVAFAKYHKLFGKFGRRFGKTKLAGFLTEWGTWTRPKLGVGYWAPEWDQCEVFIEGIYNDIDGTILEESIIDKKKFGYDLSNGASVKTKTANIRSQAGRGRGFDWRIVDEEAFIPAELMAAIRPTGFVGDQWEMHLSNSCGHNHFTRAYNRAIPAVKFRGSTFDNPLVDVKKVREEMEDMTEMEIKQEIYAEEADDDYNAFHTKNIDSAIVLARDRGVEYIDKGIEGHNYYGGLDFGRRKDKSVLRIIDHVPPYIDLVYKEEFRNVDSPTYWTDVLEKTEYQCKNFFIQKINVDSTQIGDKPTIDLKNSILENNIPTKVEGVYFSNKIKNSRDGLVNSLVLQFERKHVAMPMDITLKKQLMKVRKKIPARPTREIQAVYNLTGLDHVTALSLAVSATPLFAQSFFDVRLRKREPLVGLRKGRAIFRV